MTCRLLGRSPVLVLLELLPVLQLQRLLLLLQLLVLLGLDDDEAVELENDDERVLGSEEDVHVGDELVVEDKQEPEY